MNEIIFTVKETAKLLKTTRSTLDKWTSDGLLTKKKIGSRAYFLKKDIEKLLDTKID